RLKCQIGLVSFAGLLFQYPIDIFDLNATFEDSLVSLPSRSNAFSFGNHFLKSALNGFRFRFRPEQLLRAPNLVFIQNIVFVSAFTVGTGHAHLSIVSSPVYILLAFMYTDKPAFAITPGLLKLAAGAVCDRLPLLRWESRMATFNLHLLANKILVLGLFPLKIGYVIA